MADLTEREVRTLKNLAEKRSGVVTAFLNIADAQHLTELGFATRSRQGWDITDSGASYLARLNPGPVAGPPG